MPTPLHRLKQQGPLHLLETTFNRLIPPSVFRYSVGVVFQLDLHSLAAKHPTTAPENYQFGIVQTEPDRNRLRTATWNSVLPETTQNDIGYAVRRKADNDTDNDIVGGVWVGVDDFLESNLGFQIQLQPHQCWLYCAYIDKTARGGGIYTRLLSHVAADVLARGYTELLVVIQPWNRASMHVHQKHALSKRGQIKALKLGRTCRIQTTPPLTQSAQKTTPPTTPPIQITIPPTPQP